MLTSQAIFNKICEAAKKEDKETIRKIITTEASIDIYHGIETPVEWLAQKGEINAVNFLINHFGANMNFAAKGYARGGFVDEVTKLKELGAHISLIMTGYAMARNKKAIKELYREYQNDEYSMTKLEHAEAYGYGLSGNIKKILNKTTSTSLNSACAGLCTSGYLDLVDQFNPNYSNKDKILFCALGGHEKDVNSLLYINPSNAYRKFAVQGYVSGGHFDLALNLDAFSILEIAGSYAMNGYVKMVNELLCNQSHHNKLAFLASVLGYIMGGHFQTLEHHLFVHKREKNPFPYFFREQMLDFLFFQVSLKDLIESNGRLANQSNIYHTFAFLQNEKVMKFLLILAHSYNQVYCKHEILAKTIKLSFLRETYDLNYSQLLALCSAGNREWLMSGISIVMKEKHVPLDMIKIITSYAMNIKEKDVLPLREALIVSKIKSLLTYNLKKDISIFSNHHKHAKSFCAALEKTNQVTDLVNLIEANRGQTPAGSDPKIFSIFKKNKNIKQNSFDKHLDKANQRLKKLI